MGPRALHVQPAYPKRRLWPWVVGAVFLLVLGIWELRIHRPGSAAPAGVAPATSGSRAGSSLHGIAGRVLGPGGEPAARVTVVLLPAGSEAVTAADGSFGFQLDDGSAVHLQAHHSDLGFAAEDVRTPMSGLVLRLEPRAGLDVWVLSRGKAVPGAAVSVTEPGGEVFRADRVTDAAGGLRFLGLPPGELRVTALLEGSGATAEAKVGARNGEIVPVTLMLEP